jgi:hypothetical protein
VFPKPLGEVLGIPAGLLLEPNRGRAEEEAKPESWGRLGEDSDARIGGSVKSRICASSCSKNIVQLSLVSNTVG